MCAYTLFTAVVEACASAEAHKDSSERGEDVGTNEKDGKSPTDASKTAATAVVDIA